ncbi:VanZ like protein [Fictibacillus sp. BK138]|nr:VanZ like protein [Fictibacillus sp. BK138]
MELIIIFTVFWVIARAIVFVWRREVAFKKEIVAAALPFALMFVYFTTVFPFPFFNPYHLVGTGIEISHNVIPFKSIVDSLTHFYFMVPIRNIGGNILLFVPLGFALLLRVSNMKIWKVIMIGFLVSLTMELCQLKMGYRSFDVDDLILNTIGTIIGMAAFKGTAKILQKETFSVMSRKIG